MPRSVVVPLKDNEGKRRRRRAQKRKEGTEVHDGHGDGKLAARHASLVEAAAETGNYAVGVDSNQDYIQPGTMITSMMKGVDKSVYKVIQDTIAANGQVFSSIDSYGLAENFVGSTWLVDGTNLFKENNPDMAAEIDALIEEVAAVRAMIVNGEIVVTDVTAGG